MKGVHSRVVRFCRQERGDVLLEYVIVTLAVLLPLVGIMEGVFDPAAQVFDPSGSPSGKFGLLGDAFVGWCQRILCGIGLPVP